MGNLCSKSSNEPDHFSSPGRVLGGGGEGTQPKKATIPQKVTATTPGRTLGSVEGGGGTPGDARSAAAKAAEERAAKASKPGGKLSEQLAAQKKQTHNQTLAAGSEEARGHREADVAKQVQNWD